MPGFHGIFILGLSCTVQFVPQVLRPKLPKTLLKFILPPSIAQAHCAGELLFAFFFVLYHGQLGALVLVLLCCMVRKIMRLFYKIFMFVVFIRVIF